jgi:beta-galactosidase
MLGSVTGLVYGADYNPEQWDSEVWREDLELMRRAGVNLVNLGIFSWAELEPCLGEYRFEWLDEVMDGLAAAGIKVNLANATATPPPWFSTCYPETLPMRADGTRVWPGARQAFCPSSPVYRKHALRMTRRMAERYGSHPGLAMWHVSNEIGGHNALCYCDVSAAAFRKWLEARYGDLDEVNRVWGTSFWGQRYSEWEQVLPPRQATSFGNPAHDLDFRRFSSDACLDVYRAERDTLRAIAPDIPITTNIMPNHREFDYWDWAPEVDAIAIDHYLKAADPAAHVELAFTADVSRGLAGGAPWMLMEHSTSAVNWQPRNIAKQPGEMTRNSLQHVARGADAVMFFQWRASRFGAEKYHSAMVPHAGTDSKIWREVEQLGAILGRLGEVAGSTLHADVGLVFDWQSQWALETRSHPSVDVTYLDRVHALYRALWDAGVTADVVSPRADLSPYRLVVIPSLYVMSQATASRVERYVHGGGHVVVTYLSGIVDENLHVYTGGYPGALRHVLGVRVEEFFPLRRGEVVALDDDSRVDTWTELLHLEGARAVAGYKDGPLPGVPAVTSHRYGAGTAWYIATRLDPEATRKLMRTALKSAGVKPPIPMATAPAGLEVTRRRSATGSYLFLINHGNETAHLRTTGHELVTDRAVAGTLSLLPGKVAVVREGET